MTEFGEYHNVVSQSDHRVIPAMCRTLPAQAAGFLIPLGNHADCSEILDILAGKKDSAIGLFHIKIQQGCTMVFSKLEGKIHG